LYTSWIKWSWQACRKYTITRDKFLSAKEVRCLLRICEERALVDIVKGRKTWV